MRLRNTTDIPNEIVKQIIAFVRPSGISNFDVMLRNATGPYCAGRAYSRGSGYHETANPFVVARVPKERFVTTRLDEEWKKAAKACSAAGLPWPKKRREHRASESFPRILLTYQRGQLRGRRYWLGNRIECLVYILAHELRHLWQRQTGTKRRGMAFGSRGISSEIDTESYAIHKLREWRNRLNNAPLAGRRTA